MGLTLSRNLSAMSLKNLENLKKIMRLSNFTTSRLINALATEPCLLEDLRLKMLILSMTVNKEIMVERQGKAREIWNRSYRMTAIMNREWTGPNYGPQHVVTRLAVHCIHHRICKR